MNSISFRAPLAILAAMALGACENPVTPEHHDEPEGIVIRAAGAELIRVEGADPTGVVTGTLGVAAGAQTTDLEIVFIDHHDEEMELDDEFSLGVEPVAPAIATWQGTQAGGFTGRVSGHEAGTTTLVFQLYHGPVDSGHAEGGAFVVPVTVTAMQP